MEAKTTPVSVVINIFSKAQKGPTPRISAKFKATSIGCRIIPNNRSVTAKHARRILAFDWSGRLVDTANMTRAFNKTVGTTAIEFKIVTAIWFLYKSSVTFSLALYTGNCETPGLNRKKSNASFCSRLGRKRGGEVSFKNTDHLTFHNFKFCCYSKQAN